MSEPICELPIDYVFGDQERESIYRFLASIPINPYRHYEAFCQRVAELSQGETFAPDFVEFMRETRHRDHRAQPFVFMRNAPIDKIQPIFDFVDPVQSKHFLKRSFVAEGFLALFATLDGTHPISYLNVNDGDVFQDIYPKESMKNSQSQKALGEIHFHKDLANHFVRPDFVNILAMRSHEKNETLTTFVRNVDIFEGLDASTLETLERKAFHTPFDDLTVSAKNVELGEAEKHAVIIDSGDIRFFENRTIGLDEEASVALQKLVTLLHARKRRVLLQPGDFVAIQNNWSLHGKELGQIAEPELLPTRWMIKTVNVFDPASCRAHLMPGSSYLVNG